MNYLDNKLKLFFLVLVLFLSGCSDDQSDIAQNQNPIMPKLGSNYDEIGAEFEFQKPAKHEVLEFFSYSCIHCYRSQSSVIQWSKNKNTDTSHIRVPVAFGGNPFYSQIFYTFESMGILDQAHQRFFDALYKEKLSITNLVDFLSWIDVNGFNKNKAEQVFNSTLVRIKTNRSFDIVNQYQINLTPTFIIDGKYRTSPAKTGSHEKTIQLIDAIIKGKTSQ